MDFGEIFQRFFWLIFPVMGMVWGMIDLAARHKRARHGMDLIKSYVDQGKEPPPELLKFLDPKGNVYGESRQNGGGWVAVFLFGSLATAFILFGVVQGEGSLRNMMPFFFVAIIMGGLCLGLLVMQLARKHDDDRKPPR
jgi:hypothetical protein